MSRSLSLLGGTQNWLFPSLTDIANSVLNLFKCKNVAPFGSDVRPGYEQLANVLRNTGLPDEAVKVMIAKNNDNGRQIHGLSQFLWYKLFGPFIGFGYHPFNALYSSLVLITIGWILFRAGREGGIVTPTHKDAFKEELPERISTYYPKFSAFIYSLETFVPLLKLWMSDYWAPNANFSDRFAVLIIHAPIVRRFRFRPLTFSFQMRTFRFELPVNGPLLRQYLWCHVIAGWTLTTLWFAGLTGLLKT
jgi:hypothetical protein